jgi:nitrate reductase delta subunit
MKTYKIFALLLRYPEADWLAELPELEAILHEERRANRHALERVRPLLAFLRRPLLEAQTHYVDVFDRQQAHGLYLYEHLFGESRARGTAMVELLKEYRGHGLELDCDELPDHVPVFLEYLSLLPRREARRRLRPVAGVLRLLEKRLSHAETPYACVFAALHLLLPRGASSSTPEPPRPMEQLLERSGRTPQGEEPLLTPEAMLTLDALRTPDALRTSDTLRTPDALRTSDALVRAPGRRGE